MHCSWQQDTRALVSSVKVTELLHIGFNLADKPEIYEAWEESGIKYSILIPANDSLERDIAELLTRPVGRPSHKPVVWYKGFLYQAASWRRRGVW